MEDEIRRSGDLLPCEAPIHSDSTIGDVIGFGTESRVYSLVFHGISGLVHGDHFTLSLATARRIAVDGVDSRAAKFAEVRDDQNEIVFRYPDSEDGLDRGPINHSPECNQSDTEDAAGTE